MKHLRNILFTISLLLLLLNVAFATKPSFRSQNPIEQHDAMVLLYDQDGDVAQICNQSVYGEDIASYKKLAEAGNSSFMWKLGYLYLIDSSECPKNEKALYWYEKAANKGFSPAMFDLGVMYQNGIGVEKNDTTAFAWYLKAANLGNAAASYEVAKIYEKDVLFNRNMIVESLKWYTKSANSGYKYAQERLAYGYICGSLGFDLDYDKAFNLYQKAAAQNNSAFAIRELGYMYEQGQGTKKNITKAIELYKISAKLGYSVAKIDLGLAYLKGEGVEKNTTKAIHWLREAALEKNMQAIDILSFLAEVNLNKTVVN